MADLLIDSDVCIDHLRGARPLDVGSHNVSYSVITRCELFSGRTDEARADEFLSTFREILVDRRIAERAGRLRQRSGRLRTPDAIIAATAMEHGFDLVTRNRRDFDHVPDLRVRDPASLSP